MPKSTPLDATLASKINHYLNGAWYITTLSQVLELFRDSLTTGFVSQTTTVKEEPTEGSTVSLPNTGGNLRLLLKPAGILTAITIKLPQATGDAATATDKQVIEIFSTQTISTFTYDLNGATAVAGDSSGGAVTNGSFTLKYDSDDLTWYQQN